MGEVPVAPDTESDREAEFWRIVRYDWTDTRTGSRLHCPTAGTFNDDYWAMDDVTFACGRKVARAWIPGIFSRMGVERCSPCCDATGLPRGLGSPKNDAACRPLVGLPSPTNDSPRERAAETNEES